MVSRCIDVLTSVKDENSNNNSNNIKSKDEERKTKKVLIFIGIGVVAFLFIIIIIVVVGMKGKIYINKSLRFGEFLNIGNENEGLKEISLKEEIMKDFQQKIKDFQILQTENEQLKNDLTEKRKQILNDLLKHNQKIKIKEELLMEASNQKILADNELKNLREQIDTVTDNIKKGTEEVLKIKENGSSEDENEIKSLNDQIENLKKDKKNLEEKINKLTENENKKKQLLTNAALELQRERKKFEDESKQEVEKIEQQFNKQNEMIKRLRKERDDLKLKLSMGIDIPPDVLDWE